MNENRTASWKPGIKIADLKPGDTIYICKVVNDFDYHYECRFVSLTRGIVKAEIVSCDRKYGKKDSGETITARITKCYLWGKDNDARWDTCHWFNEIGETR